MLLPIQRGFGATTSQLVGATGSAAGTTIVTLAPLCGPSAPICAGIGAAVVAISNLLGAIGIGNGCGQTCVVASNNANQIEVQMKANLAAFQAGQIDQPTALATFDQLWDAFVAMCHQVGGDQQGNCVSDRQSGACKWKDASGACWNWFSGYRDPIAAAAPAPTASVGSVIANFTTAEWGLLGLVGLGIVAAVAD